MPSQRHERLRSLLADAETPNRVDDVPLLREMVHLLRQDLASRESLADELRKGKDRCELAIDAAGVGVWDCDLATGHVTWNEHHARIFGLTPSQFDGQIDTFYRCVHPEDREKVAKWLDAALTQRKPFNHEYRVVWPTGEVRWVDAKGQFRFDATGTATRMIGVVADVTERVEGRRIADSERQYRSLLEKSRTIIARQDRHYRHLYVNAAIERITGLKPEAFLGRTNRELGMPAHLCEQWEKVIDDAFALREPVPFTFDFPSAALGVRHFQAHFMPELAADGSIAAVVCMAFDVTDIVRHEKEMQRVTAELERRARQAEEGDRILRALMEHVPEGITVADADGTIRMVSRHGQQLAGRPKETLQGVRLGKHSSTWGLYRADGLTPAPDAELPLTRATRSGETVTNEEFVIRRPDGTAVPLLCNAGPIRDAAGQITGGIIAWRDISHRKEAEDRVRELAESLARQSRLFEQIAAATPDFIYVFDLDGRFLYANRRLLEVWGRTFDDAVGKNLYELGYPQWHADMHMREIRQVIDTRQPIKGEVPFTGGSGIFGVYEYIFTPVIGPAGQVEVITGTTRDVTARKHAEIAAADARRRLDAALIAAEVGVFQWDILDDRLWGDQNFARIFGIPLDPSGAAPLADFMAALHPDDRAEVSRRIRHSVDTGADYEAEYRIVTGGTVRWVVARGKVEIDPATGRAARFPGAVLDITARKRAEEALRVSDERFRATFEQAAVGIAHIAPDGRWLRVNLRFCAITGYSLEELQALTFQDVTHPEDLAPDLAQARRLAAGEIDTYSIEKRYIRKDGFHVWVTLTGSAVRDANGGVEYFIAVAEDISERKRAEDALRESQSRIAEQKEAFELAVSGAPIHDVLNVLVRAGQRQFGYSVRTAILIADPDGRHLRFGAAADLPESYTGAVAAIPVGPDYPSCGAAAHSGCPVIVPDITADPLWKPFLGAALSHEIRAVWSHPVLSSAGSVVGTFAVYHRAVAAAAPEDLERLKLLAQAASLVIERHRAEAALRSAKEEAERANRAKDQFLAVLSHELRTPLTPVLGTAQMLEADESLTSDQHDMVQMIRRNVELEARLIDDLLDLTRIARNKLELHLAPLDVHEKIRQVLGICADDIAAKNLDVVLRLNARRHFIQGDPTRFQQIVWNLVKNAVKFTPAGGRITVGTSDADDRLHLEVLDTGIGIDAAALPRIFDAFEQGGRDVTRQFGGLGLGLAITKALVELHAGTITAASAGCGRGASFTVVLPAVKTPEPAGRAGAPRPGAQLNCSLLLVEDHADTRRVMARLLRGLGCQVKTAGSVAEALAAAGDSPVDLVISDIGLPDGSGVDLMRQLRGRHALRGIALSGYGMDEDVARSRDAGFDAHLTKPVNLEALEAAIRRLTKQE